MGLSKTQTPAQAATVVGTHPRDAVNSWPKHGEQEQIELELIFKAHPLGVKPGGNALAAQKNSVVHMGVFGALPDETILVLLEWLDGRSLLNLGASCKTLYAYATFDPLWKNLFILHAPKCFSWRGSWRSTYLSLPQAALPTVHCSGVFSDALYRPFFCSQINLLPYTQNIPSSNRIPRLPYLTSSEFSESWSDKPFILTEPVKQWPVQQIWCQDTLLQQYGDVVFRAEAVDWPLKTYIQYMDHNTDESPLYLFDRSFVEKMDLSVGRDGGVYWPPECFGEDYFSLLGDQRPDHRWLIIGPERSGSTFHKDPNATSAWNAVIRGSKYWIMFPSSANTPPPPGVFVSGDQSEVTSPLSIAEWLLTFHEEARHTPGCLEGVCVAGEILHVPSGWWHLVVNLVTAIAITQNFVPKAHVTAAMDFLNNKPDQVSGFDSGVRNPHELFMDRLREYHPDMTKKLDVSKKRKWEDIAHDATNQNGPPAFSFGFGDEIEEA